MKISHMLSDQTPNFSLWDELKYQTRKVLQYSGLAFNLPGMLVKD